MFRIAGYHTEQTIECLTAGEIENMECTMRKFPSLLASYVDEHKIKMTTLDKLNIYACFINVATISVGYDFENFAFCPGDKALLLRVIQRMSEEITLRITDLSKKNCFRPFNSATQMLRCQRFQRLLESFMEFRQ